MDLLFPVVVWGGETVTFRPSEELAAEPGQAALVFAFHGPKVILADIAGRGWCIPGGRIEPGESAEDAALREAWEEAGIRVQLLAALGSTVSLGTNGEERPLATSFVGTVAAYGQRPEHSESLGVRRASREDVQSCYYRWDSLMAAMFDLAWYAYGQLTAGRRE